MAYWGIAVGARANPLDAAALLCARHQCKRSSCRWSRRRIGSAVFTAPRLRKGLKSSWGETLLRAARHALQSCRQRSTRARRSESLSRPRTI